MDTNLALLRLKNMVAWTCPPCLDETDLTALLMFCRRADDQNRSPGDTGYVPTYHLDWAAREAWAWKAGAVADHYRIKADDADLHRADVYANCVSMYKLYEKKAMGRPQSLRATGNLVEDRLNFNRIPVWWELQVNI